MPEFSNRFFEKLAGQRLSYRQYDDVRLAKKGIVLEQNKEPALSGAIRLFCSPEMLEKEMEDRRPEDDTITIAKKAGIIEENTGQSLYLLLEKARDAGCKLIVADALDDEPYISSQLAPAMQMSEQLVRGLRLAAEAVGAEGLRIEVYKELGEIKTQIGQELDGIPIQRVGYGYPADNSLVTQHREERAVVFGAGALIHLARAVDRGLQQTTAFVTVAGNGVAESANVEVSLDKTLGELLREFGLLEDTTRIVIGGSMRGFTVTNLDGTRITPLTRGVLALREAFKDYNFTCIGCGKCASVCPVGLAPYYIYKFVQAGRYNMLGNFDIDLCIDCGTCSYICPAKLNISAEISRGKREMLNYMMSRQKKEQGKEEEA